MSGPPGTLGAFNIFDLREQAKRKLPRGLFDFIDRGAEDEVALRHNRAAFEAIKLRPRNLNNIRERDLSVELFGERQALPLVIAPTGGAGLAWYEADIELAKAAKTAGVPFTIATPALTAMERVKEEAGGRLWFQLYPWTETRSIESMVERVKAGESSGNVIGRRSGS